MNNGTNDLPQEPFFSKPVVDSSLPPPILDPGVPQRPPTFRASQEERLEPEPLDDYSTDPDDTFEPHKHDREYAEPVPVTVVEPIPHESPIRDWSSARYSLLNDGIPVQILGANRNRVRAVCAVGAVEGVGVAFMRRPTDSPSQAIVYSGVNTAGTFAVAPTVEFSHNDEVWCMLVAVASDAIAQIHVTTEFWLVD
jgi:hypothetical protein